MTREEELQILAAFIESNGVKQLPPDQRGPEMVWSAWGKPRTKKKRGRKKKTVTVEENKQNDNGQEES